MKKRKIENRTYLRSNDSVQGEPIEHKIRRILQNNEPITDGAAIGYSDRKDGVLPQTDIRTDRFDVAIEAMDKHQKTAIATRMDNIKKREETKKIGQPETIQANEGKETA